MIENAVSTMMFPRYATFIARWEWINSWDAMLLAKDHLAVVCIPRCIPRKRRRDEWEIHLQCCSLSTFVRLSTIGDLRRDPVQWCPHQGPSRIALIDWAKICYCHVTKSTRKCLGNKGHIRERKVSVTPLPLERSSTALLSTLFKLTRSLMTSLTAAWKTFWTTTYSSAAEDSKKAHSCWAAKELPSLLLTCLEGRKGRIHVELPKSFLRIS